MENILLEQNFECTFKYDDGTKGTETHHISFYSDETIFINSDRPVLDLKTLKQIVAILETKAGKILYAKD